MGAVEEGPSKCNRKTALSLFFLLELIAYVLSCIALISPSWQYVYLENGRTEHHHGLWLDCKRDYSHDYGRNREYYETLYRLDKQQSPLDRFFLTSLLCVYKFDYYLDTEDLFDHNHDENRLQDDANQHLFLGWKIASLAALGFAALTSGAALLLSVCAFCHRTLICAAAVLVTVAALLSSMGLLVFYIWANYQDNNIIKEEDGIYEQYFGWALYMQIVGTVMHFVASLMGCIVTSMAFRKSRAKLVKIEVIDADNSSLLHRTSPPSKRSFSAVYKVDSSALREWEKDYMNIVKSGSITERRATSMPNFKKYSKKSQYTPQADRITRSNSNLFIDHHNVSSTSEALSTAPRSSPPTPKSILKSSSKQLPAVAANAKRQLSDDLDLTYEYLPSDSVNKSQSILTLNKSFTATTFADPSLYDQNKGSFGPPIRQETSINVYDKVYEHIPDTTGAPDYEQQNYFQTNNVVTEQRQDAVRGTLINDVPDDNQVICRNTPTVDGLRTAISTFVDQVPETASVPKEWRSSINRRQNFAVPSNDAFLTQRHNIGNTLVTTYSEAKPHQTTLSLREFAVEQEEESSHFSSKNTSTVTTGDVAINTFDVGTFAAGEGRRSIKNLAFRPNKAENVEAFQRSDSSEASSSLTECIANRNRKPDPLVRTILSKSSDAPTAIYDTISAPSRMYVGDETDRSVGSSATLGNDTVSGQINNYRRHRESELCLNLFMNGEVAPLATGTRPGSSSVLEAKESNITTV